MNAPHATEDPDADRLSGVIQRHWGYDSYRPLQHEAMTAAVRRRDSLVVLPTGGGKSLCYQAPALLGDKPTVVVSPLIALMKDQVDALIERDVSAAFLNSSLDAADRRLVINGIHEGAFKLIFVAPERFAGDAFLDLLESSGVGAFAIDEAHCISHWGHDFRNDYRRLGVLKTRFGDASVHAFTATATPRVRDDIIAQLQLADPVVLVGDFFRPNLTYRLIRRGPGFLDVIDVVRRRPGEAGIVYCIRRADVDELAANLRTTGIKAVGYHAGMTDEQRVQAQDAFAAGRFDVVVATVAFGMGIDRADIRYVIHAAMPKTIEHYQQETGRAGRDGKPADCILFYSGADFRLWQTIIEKSAGANQNDQIARLREMFRVCTGATCRHERLVTYFGQSWDRDNCGACDLCNGELPAVADSTVLAQKVLSGVARTNQRYGGAYVADVLLGHANERIVSHGHDASSTFGLLADQTKAGLMAWLEQLVDQEMLQRVGEFGVLKITERGLEVMRAEREAKLYDVGGGVPKKRKSRTPRPDVARPAPKDVATPPPSDPAPDPEAVILFGELRELRRSMAADLNVPAYRVFGDKTLREMARLRPTTPETFLSLHGVGRARCAQFGESFINAIRSHLGMSALDTAQSASCASDADPTAAGTPPRGRGHNPDNADLYAKLRELRTAIAAEGNIPPYCVFANKTLQEMARVRPVTPQAMLEISGVGPAKLAKLGERFIEAIKSHASQ